MRWDCKGFFAVQFQSCREAESNKRNQFMTYLSRYPSFILASHHNPPIEPNTSWFKLHKHKQHNHPKRSQIVPILLERDNEMSKSLIFFRAKNKRGLNGPKGDHPTLPHARIDINYVTLLRMYNWILLTRFEYKIDWIANVRVNINVVCSCQMQ